jgi:BlaI family transcriptional regulator, penicillinase repressor
MARRPQETPTEAELEILKVLWDRGPSTVREVLNVLNKDRKRAYTSVMSVLNIMAERCVFNLRPTRLQ